MAFRHRIPPAINSVRRRKLLEGRATAMMQINPSGGRGVFFDQLAQPGAGQRERGDRPWGWVLNRNAPVSYRKPSTLPA